MIIKNENGVFTTSDDSNDEIKVSSEDIKSIMKDTFDDPMTVGYIIGIFSTVMSVISVIINYFFYGKLYEHFHKKK